jgi:predicted nucleic acid-binding protein
VKVIVDANIVFSAILNTNSKIADLLLNSENTFDFIAPDYLLSEIKKYHQKIGMLSKMSLEEIEKVQFRVLKPISFHSGFHIPESLWIKAEQYVLDIDPKDTPYLAFSFFYDCKIWSGDKILQKGLLLKGIEKVITTGELFQLRAINQNKKLF